MKLTSTQIELLKSFVGQTVHVSNVANDDCKKNTVSYNMAGTLEVDGDVNEYYVRVGEDYFAGAIGIGFSAVNCDDVFVSMAKNRKIIIK